MSFISIVTAIAVILGFFVSLAVQVGEAKREEVTLDAADEAAKAAHRKG